MNDLKSLRELAEGVRDTGSHVMHIYPERVIELLDRLEAAEKDAARYRFLKEKHLRIWTSNLAKNYGEKSFDFEFEAKGDDADAAIDAAISPK